MIAIRKTYSPLMLFSTTFKKKLFNLQIKEKMRSISNKMLTLRILVR
jgi:DNA-binding HxlR family transcriptional regulator